jgi:DNA-binding GntR family transcriptional regulator
MHVCTQGWQFPAVPQILKAMDYLSRRHASDTSTEITSSDVIQRRTLHDQLVERVKDLINEGELAPGTRVPEKLLCLRFGVSRTPLREALKVLASEGLLDLVANRGATVARLTLADVDEMFPVMGHLEALAGELACRHVTEQEIAEIETLHHRMVAHYRRAERPAYFRLNQAIHGKILEAARNRTLLSFHASLSGRIRRARYFANMSETRWAKAVEEHESILRALVARDGPALSQILKQHLTNKMHAIREGLQSEAAAAADPPLPASLQHLGGLADDRSASGAGPARPEEPKRRPASNRRINPRQPAAGRA